MIDFHVHLWRKKDTPPEMSTYFQNRGMRAEEIISAPALLRSMDRSGIERSVILSNALTNGLGNAYFHGLNAYVQQQVISCPKRLSAFCTVDPYDPEGALKELRLCIEREGFIGLKLHPNVQRFLPQMEKCFPIYEQMQDYGLPVLFHTGGIGIAPFEDHFGMPEHIDEIACRFPNMKIIMGHCGRGAYQQAACVLRKHKHVYADISANFSKMHGKENMLLKELIQKVKLWTGSTDKLFFGSDYPYYGQLQTRYLLESVLDENGEIPITKEDLDKISCRNASSFLDEIQSIHDRISV